MFQCGWASAARKCCYRCTLERRAGPRSVKTHVQDAKTIDQLLVIDDRPACLISQHWRGHETGTPLGLYSSSLLQPMMRKEATLSSYDSTPSQEIRPAQSASGEVPHSPRCNGLSHLVSNARVRVPADRQWISSSWEVLGGRRCAVRHSCLVARTGQAITDPPSDVSVSICPMPPLHAVC